MIFQSTPPRGWRRQWTLLLRIVTIFQSTPPRGWRQHMILGTLHITVFQSTPPRGWRLISPVALADGWVISIHSTARVETVCNMARWSFFIIISIHSTARVETVVYDDLAPYAKISIHSTARVETVQHQQERGSNIYFNPLHREGGDKVIGMIFKRQAISIHSTARVETLWDCQCLPRP